MEPGNHNPPEPAAAMSSDPTEDWFRCRLLDPPLRPGVLACLDQYEILRVIGSGGMSLVFLARDPAQERPVAIKVLKPELTRNALAVERFLSEAAHMQHLSHPHILRVLAVSNRSDGPYFVLPYMERGSLAEQITPGSPLDRATILRIARGIASALSYAHRKGITHRDLKPGNVLLDAEMQPFLADFGLGRTVYNDPHIDIQYGLRAGTPAYMAPELAAGNAGDTRCDTYSFGALLYEMVTGSPPYQGRSTEMILRMINQLPPPSVLALNPKAPIELVQVIEWCMARELRYRYAEISDVLADLNRIERGQSPRGPHEQLPTAIGRKRRRPLRIWMLSLGALIVIGAVFLTWMMLRGPVLRLVQKIPVPNGNQPSHAIIRDFGGDGEKDLFLLDHDQLLVISKRGELLAKRSLPEQSNGQMTTVSDMSSRSLLRVALSWVQSGQTSVELLDDNLRTTRRITISATAFPGGTYAGNGPFLIPKAIVRSGPDDPDQLIAATLVAKSPERMGISGFSLDQDRLLWTQEIGPAPIEIAAVDIQNDGRQEILAGTSLRRGAGAPAATPGEASAHLLALSPEGKVLWTSPINVLNGSVKPLALPSLPGRPSAYCWTQAFDSVSRIGQADSSARVMRFDASGQLAANFAPGPDIYQCVPVDLGTDDARICVSDVRGEVHLLDRGLQVTRKASLVPPDGAMVCLELHAVADLDGDGLRELVFTSSRRQEFPARSPSFRDMDNEILITSSDLRIRARYLLSGERRSIVTPRLAIEQSGRSCRIISLAEEALVLELARP